MQLHDYLAAESVSQAELARRVGVTQGMVWQWLRGVRRVSAEKVLALEVATDGMVSRHEIRPDLYPRETVAPQ
jgi:DNA-binding transcriptional regulator YdaS (Cro superfamily)